MASRFTPITLNEEEHQLYFSASNVAKMLRFLRTLGRLDKTDTLTVATGLIANGDDEVIAAAILSGLEHERNPKITHDKIVDWLDEVKRHRTEQFFTEITLPIFDALKAAGQISYDVRPAAPKTDEGGAARPTGVPIS